ncbi:MAG: response regulator [Elusimicrobia bacterium]|nr:response regulator [Elusimicrobiota bacterium]
MDAPDSHESSIPTILMVDDDYEDREIVAALMRHHCCHLLLAAGAAEGLKLADQVKPDLIILDIRMPELDGLEALKKLRQNEATRETPVLMLTAADDRDSIDAAFSCGANDYMTKPIFLERLNKKIAKLLYPAFPGMREKQLPRNVMKPFMEQ